MGKVALAAAAFFCNSRPRCVFNYFLFPKRVISRFFRRRLLRRRFGGVQIRAVGVFLLPPLSLKGRPSCFVFRSLLNNSRDPATQSCNEFELVLICSFFLC